MFRLWKNACDIQIHADFKFCSTRLSCYNAAEQFIITVTPEVLCLIRFIYRCQKKAIFPQVWFRCEISLVRNFMSRLQGHSRHQPQPR